MVVVFLIVLNSINQSLFTASILTIIAEPVSFTTKYEKQKFIH
ncbi:hypothetical protein GMES_1121 [Paraglaciecola mesophila KMM 241]|uniref:Uncharacterized protein n=1 Tax=Paraglaciecola mesophila KMM 241 TaxID=1128912 RepID=K6ZJ64_9ALTE|nr:hypothetical protein GMES_1121 [Paraglaciecola mesophila KMM 241]